MRFNLIVAAAVASFAFTGMAFAQDSDTSGAPAAGSSMMATPAATTTTSSTTTTTTTSSMSNKPCSALRAACQASGKWTNKHDMWTNCIKPLVAGQSVDGVTADPAAVQACAAKMQSHHHHHHMMQPMTATPAASAPASAPAATPGS